MKVIDAIIAELQRQGVAAEMADLGFDISALARAVVNAADGHVIPFPSPPRS
jgi:hypothetical protein